MAIDGREGEEEEENEEERDGSRDGVGTKSPHFLPFRNSRGGRTGNKSNEVRLPILLFWGCRDNSTTHSSLLGLQG